MTDPERDTEEDEDRMTPRERRVIDDRLDEIDDPDRQYTITEAADRLDISLDGSDTGSEDTNEETDRSDSDVGSAHKRKAEQRCDDTDNPPHRTRRSNRSRRNAIGP